MQPDLKEFLRSRRPGLEEITAWAEGTLPLRLTCYLEPESPPLDSVTSVRSLVFRHDHVIVVRDPGGSHLLPGGRREAGESLEATLRREILEETGYTLAAIAPLRFVHFHHPSPKPPDYRYPHPDFVQLVFRAEAGVERPEAVLTGGWHATRLLNQPSTPPPAHTSRAPPAPAPPARPPATDAGDAAQPVRATSRGRRCAPGRGRPLPGGSAAQGR